LLQATRLSVGARIIKRCGTTAAALVGKGVRDHGVRLKVWHKENGSKKIDSQEDDEKKIANKAGRAGR
jgi:hypothetical protein